MRRAAVLLLGGLLVAGCNDGTPPNVQARQEALVHEIAQTAVKLPGVVCAVGQLNTEGLPSAPLGSLSVRVTTEGIDEAAQLQVMRDVARMAWESDLIIVTLVIGDPGNVASIGEALGGAPGSSVGQEQLAAAFGPRPPLPSPPLPPVEDPGNPPC